MFYPGGTNYQATVTGAWSVTTTTGETKDVTVDIPDAPIDGLSAINIVVQATFST